MLIWLILTWFSLNFDFLTWFDVVYIVDVIYEDVKINFAEFISWKSTYNWTFLSKLIN